MREAIAGRWAPEGRRGRAAGERLSLLLGAAAVYHVACQADLAVPEGAHVLCSGEEACPTDMRCSEPLGRCVRQDAPETWRLGLSVDLSACVGLGEVSTEGLCQSALEERLPGSQLRGCLALTLDDEENRETVRRTVPMKLRDPATQPWVLVPTTSPLDLEVRAGALVTGELCLLRPGASQEEVCAGFPPGGEAATSEGCLAALTPTGAAVRQDGTVELGYGGGGGGCGVRCSDPCEPAARGCRRVCHDEAHPPVEVCDSVDNDCDGETDEGVFAIPDPIRPLPIEVGEPCRGVGACDVEGRVECAGEGRAVCSTAPGGSEALSEDEVCDGADNDCDGVTDELLGCCSPGPINPEAPPEEQWVLACPGSFVMGSPGPECGPGCTCGVGEGECQDPRCELGCPGAEPRRQDPETQHRVTLTRAFLVKATEVRQEEWLELSWEGLPAVNPAQYIGARNPVERVNWYEALAYCNWLSREADLSPCYELDGCTNGPGNALECDVARATFDLVQSCDGYRLPTEAEWEHAARAGTATMFFASGPGEGDNLSSKNLTNPVLDPVAVYAANQANGTAEVASKLPNPWGLYDMLGNVFEWCWDAQDTVTRHGTAPVVDPAGLEGESKRPIRGGAFNQTAMYCRCAALESKTPAYRRLSIGFRPVRSMER